MNLIEGWIGDITSAIIATLIAGIILQFLASLTGKITNPKAILVRVFQGLSYLLIAPFLITIFILLLPIFLLLYISEHFSQCIYQPTCKEYLKQAIGEYGLFEGGRLGLMRMLRCNPFARGGHDPVPPRHTH
jgi:uncharacterized protein